MPVRLHSASADFEEQFDTLLSSRREAPAEVGASVEEIITRVRSEGDRALLDYTSRFDRLSLDAAGLAVPEAEFEKAEAAVARETRAALILARDRIQSHHQRQLPSDDAYVDRIGVELRSRWTPIEAVGLYVPGGTAAYPSSVLMNALPAKVAGVDRIVMVVPTPGGRINPLVLIAARLAGVHEVYRIGGAQAVAALAYGTETIPAVAKIVGPGNAYVAEAKRRVFGAVGIDMIAGPSEVLVIADGDNDPDWIAADLLAQAEHDPSAQSILITDSPSLADAVVAAVGRQLVTLSREDIAGKSWGDFGAVILVPRIEEDAARLANRIAAEHVQILVADPEPLAAAIRNAGAIFLDRYTPEAVGDYVGGSNHVLPTARSARFSSGLSVLDFMKRTSVLRCGPEQLRAIGPAAVVLAQAEGLDGHARSVAIRLNL